MKERMNEQIVNELRQASRNDITITIIAIIVTFVLFGMAFGFANSSVDYNYGMVDERFIELSVWATAAMFLSLIALIVIDLFSILALKNNIQRKAKLTQKLAGLYQAEGDAQLPAEDITAGYRARGGLFIIIICTLAALGVILPLIMFVNKIVEEL